MRQRWLVVMVKDPRAGRVKTRLGRDIGHVRAAWWFRHSVRRILRELRDPRWQVVLSVSPDTAVASSRFWPADLARIPQGGGDLGARMAGIFHAMPPGPVLITGGDIPGVRKRHISHAFHALAASDAVIGPAVDGGYWLIGFNNRQKVRRADFVGVRWSSEHTLTDTLACFKDLEFAIADTLADVDTKEDLNRTN